MFGYGFFRVKWEEYPLFSTIKKIVSQEIEAKGGLESLFSRSTDGETVQEPEFF